MESNGLKILIIDDSPDLHEIFKMILDENPPAPGAKLSYFHAYSGPEGLNCLESLHPDLILLDVNMPQMSGHEVCRRIRHQAKDDSYVAIIFLSGDDSPQDVSLCLDAGGDDFCSKKHAHLELPSRVRCALRIKYMHQTILRSNRELLEMNQKLRVLSEVDDLTGLLNMRSFKSRLAQEFSRSKRHDLQLSLIMFDLDFFKNVNDHSNHLMGSHVLAEIGKIVIEVLRSQDFGARFGGDEYIILLPHTSDEGAWRVAQKLEKAISQKLFTMDHFEASVTASIGVSTFGPSKLEVKEAIELIKEADQNLYRAKSLGRACICSSYRHSKSLVDYSKVENHRRCWTIKNAS
ncbi:MAG: diguanylate cyclase [Pseudomonadota bacterium]